MLTTLVNATWMSGGGQGSYLMIKMDYDTIEFWEDGYWIYGEPYELPTVDCYWYIFQSSLRTRVSGTDALDNFVIYDYPMP